MKQSILLLGGFGFIGTNVLTYIDTYLADVYDVIVFDKFSHHQKNLYFRCVKQVYSGDFTDSTQIEQIFKENKINLALHLLSTTVPATSQNIRFDIESNVIPTVELLNIMVRHKVNDIVYISSGGAIYGTNNEDGRHSETDLAYPISSYGIVKLTIEKYLNQFHILYGVNSLILRLSNPYGKYHYNKKQGVINIACRAAIDKENFFVWGDGNSKKDYIYIDDFCSILFLLLKKDVKTGIVNVGSSQLASINDILNVVKQGITTFTWDYRDKLSIDVDHFELNTSKLTSLIGKYNFTSLEQGINRTIKWIKEQNR